MATPKGPSLIEFAAAQKVVTGCRICELADIAEINEARKVGVSLPNIIKWVERVKGLDRGWVTKARLSRHFNEHHDD